MVNKPYSQACDNNKEPILSVLKQWLNKPMLLLEVGSGTGQHAAFFSQHLPHVQWQTSDLLENHAGINAWCEEAIGAGVENLLLPLILDVNQSEWPVCNVDCVFTANTCHIMSWDSVQQFIPYAADALVSGGLFCVYGPFNYPDEAGECQYTSESNAHFDSWLKQQNPVSGIRDITAIKMLANDAGFVLQQDNAMPANNRLLVWRKV